MPLLITNGVSDSISLLLLTNDIIGFQKPHVNSITRACKVRRPEDTVIKVNRKTLICGEALTISSVHTQTGVYHSVP